MLSPNLLILYVENPLNSHEFYRKLLQQEAAAVFPTYVAFPLRGGWTLGLWANHRVDPAPPTSGNRSEISFMVRDEPEVRKLHSEWKDAGVRIEREPYRDVFGLTFVALDPDGHRIRVCLPDNPRKSES